MKIVQITNNKVHWDATSRFPTLKSTVGFFPMTDLFVEAPDEVQEGWNYDQKTNSFTPPEKPKATKYTELQLLGQQITDEELARIALGQQVTDLELMVLGGNVNV